MPWPRVTSVCIVGGALTAGSPALNLPLIRDSSHFGGWPVDIQPYQDGHVAGWDINDESAGCCLERVICALGGRSTSWEELP